MNLSYSRGLVIVYPYGTFIRKREKTMIVKTKKVSSIIEKKLLLIEDKLGLGIIILSEPIKINLKQFRALYKYHLITEADRQKWWPKYTKLYAYDIINVKFFRHPILLEYGAGPQITVKPENVEFLKIFIGMSGYYYRHMYPDKTKDILKYYSENLNSVEINSTFYRLPTNSTIKNLLKYDLAYTFKVSRYITHTKRLKDISKYWKNFYDALKPLHNNIFCFLFQFSANFIFNEENFKRLSKLSSVLNRKGKGAHHYAFEFREIGWFNERIRKLFEKNNWIFVIVHVENNDGWAGNLADGFNPPLNKYTPTSDTIYFRMHGTKGQYIGSYNNQYLNKIREFIAKYKPAYSAIYFNNTDANADSLDNAITLYNKFNPYNLTL